MREYEHSDNDENDNDINNNKIKPIATNLKTSIRPSMFSPSFSSSSFEWIEPIKVTRKTNNTNT